MFDGNLLPTTMLTNPTGDLTPDEARNMTIAFNGTGIPTTGGVNLFLAPMEKERAKLAKLEAAEVKILERKRK